VWDNHLSAPEAITKPQLCQASRRLRLSGLVHSRFRHGCQAVGWEGKKIPDAQSECPGQLCQPGLKSSQRVRVTIWEAKQGKKIRKLSISEERTVGSSCFCCF